MRSAVGASIPGIPPLLKARSRGPYRAITNQAPTRTSVREAARPMPEPPPIARAILQFYLVDVMLYVLLPVDACLLRLSSNGTAVPWEAVVALVEVTPLAGVALTNKGE